MTALFIPLKTFPSKKSTIVIRPLFKPIGYLHVRLGNSGLIKLIHLPVIGHQSVYFHLHL